MIIISLALDLANILGGLLLAASLLVRIPSAGEPIGRFAAKVAPWGWIVGIVALVAGGYYLLVHLFTGGLYIFEIVGIGVGVALLWERLTGRSPARSDGATLLLAIFGIIAIVVGLQGLLTPG